MGVMGRRSDFISSEETVIMTKASKPGCDYELPQVIPHPSGMDADATLSGMVHSPFSAEGLAAAFSSGCSSQAIKTYLQSYPLATVTGELDILVRHHHLITYAVERNSAECVQPLIDYGASPNAKDFGDVPVLALAIMRTKWTVRNTTEIVRTLLANGADHRCIPADMWSDYVNTPKADAEHKSSDPSLITRTKWCTPERRSILAETLNLTMRYYL